MNINNKKARNSKFSGGKLTTLVGKLPTQWVIFRVTAQWGSYSLVEGSCHTSGQVTNCLVEKLQQQWGSYIHSLSIKVQDHPKRQMTTHTTQSPLGQTKHHLLFWSFSLALVFPFWPCIGSCSLDFDLFSCLVILVPCYLFPLKCFQPWSSFSFLQSI